MKNITVIIPTSPIPAHPKTDLIEDVVESVRFHLPDCRIIISCDGVRDSVKHRTEQYNEYKENLKSLCTNVWSNVELFTCYEPNQQVGMIHNILNNAIETDLVMALEHDCILTKDFIDWNAIGASLMTGDYNIVRLYWRDRIHPEHFYLTHGEEIQWGAPFLRTTQFSGWVNIAKSSYYRDLLARFDRGELLMVETLLYGPIVNSPWEDYKMAIYYPENATRFIHANGRQGDTKEW